MITNDKLRGGKNMFKMVGMGDLHFPSRNKKGELLSLEERSARDDFYAYYFNQFFNQEADIYFSVGDITTGGYFSEYDDLYKIIGDYNKPFRQVFGNHDLLEHSKQEIYERMYLEHYNHCFTYEDFILVYLETGREKDHSNFGGWISSYQKDWLSNIMTESGAKTVIVIAHHPVYNTTKNTVEDMHNVDPQTELWSILEKKQDGTGIYINGHVHEDSTVQRNNWHFIQFCAVLDDPALRMITVSNDTFAYQTKRLMDKEMRQKAKCVGEFNEQFHLQHDGPGSANERRLTIDLRENSIQLNNM